MGIAAAIIGAVGGISAVLGVLTILEVTPTPILSDKLTWPFWFGLAVILLLASIIFSLNNHDMGD
jgi:hypothetical protein